MKALEKDRTRRYESASSFAQDIQRHLNTNRWQPQLRVRFTISKVCTA